MDWSRDFAGLSGKNLDNVFRYEEKSTTVVRMLADEGPVIWSLEEEDEWLDWIQKECPRIDGRQSGLVVILAKRTGEVSLPIVKKVRSDDWLERIKTEMPDRPKRAMTFESLGEKAQTTIQNPGSTNMSGRRSVRTLPFSKDIFRLIAENFYVHNSIARVISRADVPVFSSSEIQMKELHGQAYPAYVYNCRSSNAWGMDLALTATYFPHCCLTFAVLFGCSLSVEEEVLRRLSLAMAEAAHPLLMPGIFAELERSRHVHIVEATIDDLEARILDLDFRSSNLEGMADSEAEQRNQDKRTAWLDTTYLRNSLISWNTQLGKMGQHADILKETVFKSTKTEALTHANVETRDFSPEARHPRSSEAPRFDHPDLSDAPSDGLIGTIADVGEKGVPHSHEGLNHEICGQKARHRLEESPNQQDVETIKGQLRWSGLKINDRIQDIINEYNDKVRDCSMRVDGMAMATQWAQGETNVEIALATSRDSRHMRSIALVTMVFLPGTFFAAVFSMTFFNWSGAGGAVVSKYLWIYVVISVICTLLTVGCWWYFVAYRRSRSRKVRSEEEVSLVTRA